MATYVVGDVQGCFRTLEKLVARIAWKPGRDRMVLCGDLVNRGPRSLEVLRWAHDSGVDSVLGNHDVHLLARAEGLTDAKKRDTLDDVLGAQDRGELLGWLRARPLVWREGDWVVVHAGLLPQWSTGDAERLAREAEAVLQSRFRDLWEEPVRASWDKRLAGLARARTVVAAMTRLRVCTDDGRMDLSFDRAPEYAPKKMKPWFETRRRTHTVVFGHWSALGLHVGDGAIGIDTGCVWGGPLTALRLEDRKLFHEPCSDRA